MKNNKIVELYLKFTKHQRAGIIGLFSAIILLELFYCFVEFKMADESFSNEENWISLQSEVDSLRMIKSEKKQMQYCFNPNFISDYKGYKLGMSVKEIDRLMAFRKENKYVNSAEEFQNVTKISDSLLKVIAPLFKFPNWAQGKSNFKTEKKEYFQKTDFKKGKIIISDINEASQEDLMKVYGVGEALSSRILKQKEILGGFVSMEQMKDVWGLSPEVIVELNLHFKAVVSKDIKKIAINEVSLKELAQFSYFKYNLAKQIITYRSMNGNFNNIEDLTKIKDFPVEKAKIISLYLEF